MRKKVVFALICAILLLLFGCGQKRPVIYAPNARVQVGESYDADDGVHALDAVDGDLTDELQVTRGELDVQKAGRYRICYEVTNSRGYRVRTCRIITVSNQSTSFVRTLVLIAGLCTVVLALCFAVRIVRSRKNAQCIELPENEWKEI